MEHTILKSCFIVCVCREVDPSQELKSHLTYSSYLTADALLEGFVWVPLSFLSKSNPKQLQSVALSHQALRWRDLYRRA